MSSAVFVQWIIPFLIVTSVLGGVSLFWRPEYSLLELSEGSGGSAPLPLWRMHAEISLVPYSSIGF